MWQIVVLITKGEGNFRGIGLVKVLWKAIMSLLNCLLTEAISFHDNLLGFWAGQGMGTATLEANPPQQITTIREAVLLRVFLDIRKSYDALDRERALDLLTVYLVGPRMVQLLRTYWYQLTMVAKVGS